MPARFGSILAMAISSWQQDEAYGRRAVSNLDSIDAFEKEWGNFLDRSLKDVAKSLRVLRFPS